MRRGEGGGWLDLERKGVIVLWAGVGKWGLRGGDRMEGLCDFWMKSHG